MPKNLKPYYNYVYKKPIKKLKSKLFIIFYIFVVILTLIFSNLGFLQQLTQKKFVVLKTKTYYALTLFQNNSNLTNIDLQNLGCATNIINDCTYLNIYLSEQTCEKVKLNLQTNNLNCETKKIQFLNLTVKNSLSSNSRNILKDTLNYYLTICDKLIGFCEKFDKNLMALNDVKNNIANYKNNLLNKKETIKNFNGSNLFGKTTVLINSGVDILEKFNNLEQESISSKIKQYTISFILNFYNLMY